jgi:ribosomal protein S18 acetylase RimI-like enzyme
MPLPPGVALEPATTDDVDRLADLWVDLARDQRDHGSHLRADANRSAVRETVARHVVTGGLLVARVDGEDAEGTDDADDGIAGFVMFGPETVSYEQDVSRVVVQNIYVVPGRQRQGIGSALLSAAEDALRDSGADAVVLETMADNDAARAFYRRHGYEPHRVELEKQTDTHTKP